MPDAIDRHALRRIPNALTISRMGLAVVFPWIPEHLRSGLIAIALLTEFFDGFLARRFGWVSRIGQLLDPIADKVLCATVVGTFVAEDRLSWVQLGAVAIRDIGVLLGAAWVTARGLWAQFQAMKPDLLGKVTTGLQYAVFFVLAFGWPLPPALVIVTFAAGFAAAIQYGLQFRARLAGA